MPGEVLLVDQVSIHNHELTTLTVNTPGNTFTHTTVLQAAQAPLANVDASLTIGHRHVSAFPPLPIAPPQLGLTFSNDEGELAPGVCTYQFNFKFSLTEDMHAQDSIDLLKEAGIDFGTARALLHSQVAAARAGSPGLPAAPTAAPTAAVSRQKATEPSA